MWLLLCCAPPIEPATEPPYPLLPLAAPQTSLQRLDLSLNAITHARGLSRLTALEDLSLFGNRISSVDGLAQLSALRALSLGAPPPSRLSSSAAP